MLALKLVTDCREDRSKSIARLQQGTFDLDDATIDNNHTICHVSRVSTAYYQALECAILADFDSSEKAKSSIVEGTHLNINNGVIVLESDHKLS